MSKEAAVRAMREARYATRPAATAPPTTARSAPTRRTDTATARPPVAPAADPAPAVTTGSGQACGHRSMNGRTCTREPDHAAKNHRYS